MKHSFILKGLLILSGFSLSLMSYAGPIIMPVPIHHSHGGGDPNMHIAAWIGMNVCLLALAGVRSLIWLIKRPDSTYFQYVWSTDSEYVIAALTTMFLVVVNSLAIVLAVTLVVLEMLEP